MEYYAQENHRKRMHHIAQRELEEYNASVWGKTMNSWKKYLYILVPFFILLAIYEDAGNTKSPRRGWWKNRIVNIPDFEEWVMFEAPGAWLNQKKKELNDKKSNEFLRKEENED